MRRFRARAFGPPARFPGQRQELEKERRSYCTIIVTVHKYGNGLKINSAGRTNSRRSSCGVTFPLSSINGRVTRFCARSRVSLSACYLKQNRVSLHLERRSAKQEEEEGGGVEEKERERDKICGRIFCRALLKVKKKNHELNDYRAEKRERGGRLERVAVDFKSGSRRKPRSAKGRLPSLTYLERAETRICHSTPWTRRMTRVYWTSSDLFA